MNTVKKHNQEYIKKHYPYGIPDNLTYDTNRKIQQGSREKWLFFLESESLTQEEFDSLNSYKRYCVHCNYCDYYNIPTIMD